MSDPVGKRDATDLQKTAEDDFFCLRFGVWYPSIDCAYRTRWRTCAACDNCDQGRFNLKRHATALVRIRPQRPPLAGAR